MRLVRVGIRVRVGVRVRVRVRVGVGVRVRVAVRGRRLGVEVVTELGAEVGLAQGHEDQPSVDRVGGRAQVAARARARSRCLASTRLDRHEQQRLRQLERELG